MRRDSIKVGVELDRETDLVFRDWSKDEGRSKRRHLSIFARRGAQLRKIERTELLKMTSSDVLRHLGLVP